MYSFRKVMTVGSLIMTFVCYALLPFLYQSIKRESPHESGLWIIPVVVVFVSCLFWLIGAFLFFVVGKRLATKLNAKMISFVYANLGITVVFLGHSAFVAFSVIWLLGFRG